MEQLVKMVHITCHRPQNELKARFEISSMPKKFDEFNDPKTLAIISPYSKSRGNFRGFSIDRYTKLISSNFPKNQKAVIFCEKAGMGKPYLASKNILVVPSYKINSFSFLKDLVLTISKFSKVKNFLIQFEFSIFGGKIVVPQFLALLVCLKLTGKSIKISLHQVVTDLGSLSGHLALAKDSLKTKVLNTLLKSFYLTIGVLADRAFVHDSEFAERASKYINKSKIQVIPHGADFSDSFKKRDMALAKKHFGANPKHKLVGIFGYCSWYKGTDWLIENFAVFAKKHPEMNVRLLVAGGESPTLKGTLAYKKYHAKLKRVIKEANGSIIYTGYIPQKDVKRSFAACDLMVFPYRTKMSASGAFSLSVGLGKPFIASRQFSENLKTNRQKKHIFSLSYSSFEKCLLENLKSPALPLGIENKFVSWQEASLMYLEGSLQGNFPQSKLEYAEVA